MSTDKLQQKHKNTVEVRVRLPIEVKQMLDELANVYDVPLNHAINLLINKLLNRKPDILDIIRCSFTTTKFLPSIRKLNSAFSHLQLESPSNCDRFMEKSDLFLFEARKFIEQIAEENNHT